MGSLYLCHQFKPKYMKKLTLVLALLLFTITTALMIMVPYAIKESLDIGQKLLLIILGVMGYMSSFLYFITYKNNKI